MNKTAAPFQHAAELLKGVGRTLKHKAQAKAKYIPLREREFWKHRKVKQLLPPNTMRTKLGKLNFWGRKAYKLRRFKPLRKAVRKAFHAANWWYKKPLLMRTIAGNAFNWAVPTLALEYWLPPKEHRKDKKERVKHALKEAGNAALTGAATGALLYRLHKIKPKNKFKKAALEFIKFWL